MNIPKKARGFIIDKITGKPLRGITVSLIGEPDDKIEVLLGILSSDVSGYVSFNLGPLLKIRNNLKRLCVTALDDEKNTIDIPNRYPDNIETPIGFQFLLKVDKEKCTCNVNLPSVQNVDIYDWQLSPYSFSIKPGLFLGEGCCETPTPSHIAEKDFRFYKVVRRFEKQDNNDATNLLPIDVSKPHNINVDNLPIRSGEVLEFRQQWFPLGHSLGQVVYSLPLAPCESVNIALIDWSRQDMTVRTDDVKATEALYHQQRRDRTIEETIESALNESQGGWSLLGGQTLGASAGGTVSASGTVPVEGVPVNLAGTGSGSLATLLGIGGSISNTWGDRDLTGDSLQDLHDTITQATSVTRTLNSTVVIQATQAEQNVLQTRTVTNHNHCHALTVQYYEVLRNFKIVTEFVQRRPVVLLPYALFSFDWELALRFRAILELVLIDKKLSTCFDAINRLHFCEAAYSTETDRNSKGDGNDKNQDTPKTISRYQMTLETGNRETWGAIWVKLIDKSGNEKRLFLKESVKFGGGGPVGSEGVPGYELTKNSKKIVDIVNEEAIGIRVEDIVQIKVEWVEANANDAWSFKGIGITYELSNLQTGKLLINNSEYYVQEPEIQMFDDSGNVHLTWVGNARGVTAESSQEDKNKPSKEKDRVPRKVEDECCETTLLKHLNYNLAFYNRAIWLLQDATERRMQLESSLQDLPNILNGLSDYPLAVSGNYIAFAYDDPLVKNGEIENKKKEDQKKYNVIEPRIVSLPTRGLFAEAQLGSCNSCEVRDVTRFWKWEESPCEKPPAIGGITPGAKGQAPAAPQPASLPSPVVNVLQAPSAPDPVGLAAALKLMETPNIFRDMSGLEEVSQLLNNLANGTVSSMQEAQKIAQQAQTKLKTEQLKAAGGTSASKPSQSPEQRYDNLQVAKEASKSAAELGIPLDDQQEVFKDVLGTNTRDNGVMLISDDGVTNLENRWLYEDIDLVIRLFIPCPIIAPPDPTNRLPVYGGDDRSFSLEDGTERVLISIVVNPDPTNNNPIVYNRAMQFGETHEYDRADAEPVPKLPEWWWQLRPGIAPIPVVDRQIATPDRLRAEFFRIKNPDVWRIRFTIAASLAASNPLVRNTAFGIDAQITLDLKPLPGNTGEVRGKAEYYCWGNHDGFPAYEIYLNGEPVYRYDPVINKASPLNLAPPMDKSFATAKSLLSTQPGFAPVPPKKITT